MSVLTSSIVWKNLEKRYKEISKITMREMFENDKNRFEKFSLKFNDFLIDYSKNIITKDILSDLIKLAEFSGLKENIENQFNGKKINFTEQRAVLHTALRSFKNYNIEDDQGEIFPRIQKVRQQMKEFSNKIHSGEFQGFSGKNITDIINIGIGGSDLGPMMVCEALKPYAKQGINVHFVSNVDGSHIAEVLKKINPETSLFIIASKTFTTQETITNANTAKDWFLKNTGNDLSKISKHFIALSTNIEEVQKFGINPANMFEFWDWVGGRYSLWSSIGLSISLYIGYENFEELLKGANEIDEHFRTAPFEKNIPVIMALLGIWYSNYFDSNSYGIMPYDQYLDKLPDFLQQMDMESNGKYVDFEGNEVDYKTCTVIWGRAGTNAQHSFFQLLHQGTQVIPCDFIAPIFSHNQIGEHHNILLSNFLAQTEALMKGKNEQEVMNELNDQGFSIEDAAKLVPHKVFKGNRPTNSILIEKITPRNLGSLIAIYEHKVFVQGIIWRINSFDQWGVELGKQLAKQILPELKLNKKLTNHDSSTNGLINYIKKYS